MPLASSDLRSTYLRCITRNYSIASFANSSRSKSHRENENNILQARFHNQAKTPKSTKNPDQPAFSSYELKLGAEDTSSIKRERERERERAIENQICQMLCVAYVRGKRPGPPPPPPPRIVPAVAVTETMIESTMIKHSLEDS